jgi:cellulose synthase/poly-beta-1,6-N-acetylglucosamine synthase-like glycosyltransferase
VTGVLVGFAIASLVYLAALNSIYLVLTAVAWRSVIAHLRARRHSAVDEAFASPLTPPISILVPAHNEEAGIVESVRSLLALRYPSFEIVVVDDGSTDGTLARLVDAFDLVPIRKALRTKLPSSRVRATFASRRHRELVVIQKENGGKADALNAAVNAARFPYVCALDADAVIEEEALIRVAKPVLDDPDLVAAAGGIVRVANGCEIDHGRITRVRLPRSRLATLQTVEYFRAFLVGRVGWSQLNALLIISGAFGLFRRTLVEAVGGYSTATVGEDIDLVLRLHVYLRERGEPYRIAFVPDPVCWTEAPEDLGSLARQRRRWHRGLAEALWNHRRAIANPRYGTLGLLALPYLLVFELVGSLAALVGLPATLTAWSLGALTVEFVAAFLLVWVLLGTLLSVAALALEELSFRRHASNREIARLTWYALVENLGYRQLNEVWRLLGLVDLVRGKQEWGAQRRRGFQAVPYASGAVLAPVPVAPSLPVALSPPVAVSPPVAAGRSRAEGLRIGRLEQLVRAHSATAAERDDERRFTLLYLRGYAGLDGRLPESFDALVDDVFGDLLDPVAERR